MYYFSALRTVERKKEASVSRSGGEEEEEEIERVTSHTHARLSLSRVHSSAEVHDDISFRSAAE